MTKTDMAAEARQAIADAKARRLALTEELKLVRAVEREAYRLLYRLENGDTK